MDAPQLPPPLPSPPAPLAPLTVACLCAEWCGVCREYRSVFERVGRGLEGRVRFRWIDVEDQADQLAGVDVDDFPTLLIGRGDALLFFGAVMPQAPLTERLVQGALAGDLPALEADEALRAALRWAGRADAADACGNAGADETA